MESEQEDGSPQNDDPAIGSHYKDKDSGSGRDGNTSESEVESKETCPIKKTVKDDSNTTLPELDSKDSEEEQKTNHRSFAHCTDAEFGAWRDKMIADGHRPWAE